LTKRSHQAATDRLRAAEGRLLLLSPERVLARGYSLTTDATSGKVIRAADQTVKGQTLLTRLHKGSIKSRVEAKQDNL
jgi:exodeoxyribonuclease VII large subunit